MNKDIKVFIGFSSMHINIDEIEGLPHNWNDVEKVRIYNHAVINKLDLSHVPKIEVMTGVGFNMFECFDRRDFLKIKYPNSKVGVCLNMGHNR